MAHIAPGGPWSGLLSTHHFKITIGRFWIEFRSDDVRISRQFVHDFSGRMIHTVQEGFAGTFSAMLSHAGADVTVYVRMGVK